jgi:tetratricopeptide (TPR) repeat protein
MRFRSRRIPLAPALLALLLPVILRAQEEPRLGSVVFDNSGADAAQAAFTKGVLLLHSFEYEDAALAFREAQEIDPDFGMAYWGEAMTHNHPLWREQDRDAARAVLARYAPTRDARQRKAATEREAAYLAAVDVLYGDGPKGDRDRAYMAAMARLAAAHPDDPEARAFHALSILGSTDGERDFATYMRAAATAQPVFRANPDHPGAAHYLIHSFDDPIHAPLGLPAARAYSEIAPGAAHAQHMTSHIFVALGMWDDVVAANIRARDVQNARRSELGRSPNVCGHYTSWLHYGWLMQHRLADAERGMTECRDRILEEGTPGEIGYFVRMRGRQVVDTGDWDAAERFAAPVDRPGYHFVTGYAAVKQGDRETAVAALSRLGSSGDGPRRAIERIELEALLALDSGDGQEAIRLLEEAAAIEETLPLEFGPPASLKPPHELLGEVALEAGDAGAAMAAFRRALELTPNRTPSLEGLLAAAVALDETDIAGDARTRLEDVLRHAATGPRD